MKKLYLFFLLIPAMLYGQEKPLISKKLPKELKKHVYFLADDALEGRLTGSAGEQTAARYIESAFKKAGLQPAGDSGFFQSFTFPAKATATANNKLTINGVSLILNEDFYPVSSSSSDKYSGEVVDMGFGIMAPELNYNSYEGMPNVSGKAALVKIGTPDEDNPHGKFAAYAGIDKKITAGLKIGVKAFIFYNDPNSKATFPSSRLNARAANDGVPIVVLTASGYKKVQTAKSYKAEIQVELDRQFVTGTNVAGFIDNKAAYTVLIGAHYDHLGYGELGGSLHVGERAIHNGADDNASGTAGLISLSSYLKKEGPKKYNYLLIAFSGEELGLLGSAFFAKSDKFNANQVAYMLNMDMIGRLNPETKILGVNGVGTSPAWKTIVDSTWNNTLKIKTTQSGMGSSDHTSFYLKQVPVLHFFSGTHTDYHKPSDDADKINYSGMADILNFMAYIINSTQDLGKLNFTETKDDDQNRAVSFKVTLGVIPDYLYEGKGLRIDGASKGKPAETAGLMAGDIILKIGDFEIKDINAYMKTLGQFNKGDTTTIQIERNGKVISKSLTF